MGVYSVSWSDRVMVQANTFWLYALSFSIAGACWRLLFGLAKQSPQPTKKNERAESEKATPSKVIPASMLAKQIIADGCDLLIPLELLGWWPTGDVVIGSTMVLSTLLAAQDIWARA